VATARGIYLEAIDANPSVTMLRCALAELEESAGQYCFLLCTIVCVRCAVVLTINAKKTPYCVVYASIVHIATGALDAAKEVLRVTFEQNPSGATFSMFQRFIRRTLGIAAARRMFSETHSMRANNPKLSLEVGDGCCNGLLEQL
jgi:hypothetical protein